MFAKGGMPTRGGEMSLSTETSAATRDVDHNATQTTAADGTSPAPVLITEQEVMFGTRAALSTRVAAVHRRLFDAIRVAAAPPQSRPRRHYPIDTGYLEHSRMAREMDRL
jgi:hypothetical protein